MHCKASYGDAVFSFYRPRASCFSASPTSCVHTEHWSPFCSYQQSQAHTAGSDPYSVGPNRERLRGARLDNAVQALLRQRRVVAEAVEVPRQRVEHRVRVSVHAGTIRSASGSFANGETGQAVLSATWSNRIRAGSARTVSVKSSRGRVQAAPQHVFQRGPFRCHNLTFVNLRE